MLAGLQQMGLTYRGLYGEGSEVVGNFFQISNQTTLGKSEEELISDFRQWGSWSPYEHKDPAMKRTFSGAKSGARPNRRWREAAPGSKTAFAVTAITD